MKYLTQKLCTLTALMSLLFIAAPAVVLAADCANPTNTAAALGCGVDAGPNCTGACANPEKTINTTVNNIINVFSALVGLVAVLMIVFGGYRYITSAGDSTKVNSAKDTVLYAVVGLIIVALAQVIVKYVIHKTPG